MDKKNSSAKQIQHHKLCVSGIVDVVYKDLYSVELKGQTMLSHRISINYGMIVFTFTYHSIVKYIYKSVGSGVITMACMKADIAQM